MLLVQLSQNGMNKEKVWEMFDGLPIYTSGQWVYIHKPAVREFVEKILKAEAEDVNPNA